MACSHREIKGDTTKYFYCNVKEKAVDDCMDCSRCLLKLEKENDKLNEIFGQIFGKGFSN